MMTQSTIVFLFMVLAFLIFIAQRGEIPAYLALLYGGGTPTAVPKTGGASASAPSAGPSTGGSNAASATGAAVKTAGEIVTTLVA